MSHNLPARLFPQWSYKVLNLPERYLTYETSHEEPVEATISECLTALLKLGKHLLRYPKSPKNLPDHFLEKVPEFIVSQATIGFLLECQELLRPAQFLHLFEFPLNIQMDSDTGDVPQPPARLFPQWSYKVLNLPERYLTYETSHEEPVEATISECLTALLKLGKHLLRYPKSPKNLPDHFLEKVPEFIVSQATIGFLLECQELLRPAQFLHLFEFPLNIQMDSDSMHSLSDRLKLHLDWAALKEAFKEKSLHDVWNIGLIEMSNGILEIPIPKNDTQHGLLVIFKDN
ncbi:hypothetical protein E2320_015722 [Naja naja]|nr:hypothetical protein E2320_015722 [Naja naja]